MKTKTLLLFTLLILALSAVACEGAQTQTAVAAQNPITQNPVVQDSPAENAVTQNGIPQNSNAAGSEIMLPTVSNDADTANPAPGGNDCPTENFPAVTAHPANSAYPDPELTVSCTATTLTVQSNGIPSYEYVNMTPNGLSEQNYQWTVPLNPTEAASPIDVSLVGPIGFVVNGMPIYAPNEAPRDNYGDAYLDGLLDYCNGHTAQAGTYHYHARPDCLFTNVEGNPYLVMGYGFDGYPILAPYACDDATCSSVSKMESSWQETGDGYQRGDNTWEVHDYVAGSGDLDQCNGKTLADGSYAYFATDTFPYFLGCYHGEVSTGGNAAPNGAAPQTNQPAGNNQPVGQTGGQSAGQTLGQPTGQTDQQNQAGQPGQPGGQGPDFAAAAQQLGVTEEALLAALGVGQGQQGRPDLQAAATALNVSLEELRSALGPPPNG